MKHGKFQKKSFVLPIVVILLCCVLVGGIGFFLIRKPEKDNLIAAKSADEAIEQLAKMGEEFGCSNALNELTELHTTNLDGDKFFRLQQNYQGIPVYGRNIICVTDEKGIITSVTGNVCDISDDVKITPAITYAQAVNAANTYFHSNYGIENICGNTSVSIDEENLCLYNMEGESLLTYSIFAGGYEILVDAHNAEVISIRQRMNANSEKAGTSNSDSNYAWKNTDGTYILRDSERNIYIYDAGKKTYWNLDTGEVDTSVLSLVTSQDATFGNSDDNTDTSSTAISFWRLLASVYDYYKSNLYNETGCGAIAGIYDDALGRYNGDNAGGGLEDIESALPSTPPGYDSEANNDKIGVIIMGTKFSDNFLSAVDTVGHEYTHFVTDKYVSWTHSSVTDENGEILTETNSENGAIREGLSDIFGELIELHLLNKTDWEHGSRTIYNPSINGYPEKYGKAKRNGNGWVIIGSGTTDYAHGYSTVISRAAYLMWNGIDGDDSKKISPDDLAKLWYRAMLMMPSDCEFIECRHLVEFAAKSMGSLTDRQISCVREAFDMVGIYSDVSIEAELTYRIKPNSKLSVMDKNGQPYAGYSLDVRGFKTTILWHQNPDGTQREYIGGEEYSSSIEVNEVPTILDLPNGYYKFTISDQYHPDSTYSFTVSIGASWIDEEIVLYTDYENPLLVNNEEYSWVVGPTIEADDIYYLADYPDLERPVNDFSKQADNPNAVIQRGKELGIIDLAGNLLTEVAYKEIANFGDSYMMTRTVPEYSEEFGMEWDTYWLNEEGEIKADVGNGGLSSMLYYYYDGIRQSVGFLRDDFVQETAIPVQKSSVYDASDIGVIERNLSGKYALDRNGNLVTDFVYDECGSLSDGLAAVCQNGKWGYVNDKGEVIIPIEYDASWQQYPIFGMGPARYSNYVKEYCYAASDNYVVLCQAGEWELKDTTGNSVIQKGIFEAIRPVFDGKCWVKKDGKWGVIQIGDKKEETQNTEDNSDEDTLKKLLMSYTSEELLNFIYDDFDNNGVYEAIAFCGEHNAEEGSYFGTLYLVTNQGVSIIREKDGYWNSGVVYDFGNAKIISITQYFTTGGISYYYQIIGNEIVEIESSGKGNGLFKDNDGRMCMNDSQYDASVDGTGHTWNVYYFYWDNDLKEYGGTEISIGEFSKYHGADAILSRISKDGFDITTIYKRANGIININCCDGWSNNNVRVLLEGEEVSVLPVTEDYYYEEGIIKPALIPEIATY